MRPIRANLLILPTLLVPPACGEPPGPDVPLPLDGPWGTAVAGEAASSEEDLGELLAEVVHIVASADEPGPYAGAGIGEAASKALGHVYVENGPHAGVRPGDEAVLVMREARDETAPAVASFSFADAEGSTAFGGLRSREEGLLGELVLLGEREYGLVVDGIDGEWARAVYARTPEGDPRWGWVLMNEPGVGYASYEDQILEGLVWFEEPDVVRFHRAPGGEYVGFELFSRVGPEETRVPDYRVEVLEVEGGWARVRVTVPDVSTCTGDPWADVIREAELWVPLRDEKGRRRLRTAAIVC